MTALRQASELLSHSSLMECNLLTGMPRRVAISNHLLATPCIAAVMLVTNLLLLFLVHTNNRTTTKTSKLSAMCCATLAYGSHNGQLFAFIAKGLKWSFSRSNNLCV